MKNSVESPEANARGLEKWKTSALSIMNDFYLELGRVPDESGVHYEIDDKSLNVGKRVFSIKNSRTRYIEVIDEKRKKADNQESGDVS